MTTKPNPYQDWEAWIDSILRELDNDPRKPKPKGKPRLRLIKGWKE